MTGRRRRCSPLPWIGLSLLLLLVPASISQKARLTLLGAFRPPQALARGTLGLTGRVLGSGPSAEQAASLAFFQDQSQRLGNDNDILRRQLEMATGLKQTLRDLSPKLLAADVLLPTDGSPWRKSITLALGSRGGVRKGMLVLYNSQFVGRVQEVGPWTSRVMLCTDPGFRAGAVAVPRSGAAPAEKRQVGVYEGTAGEQGHLKWLTGDTPVEADALVLTTEDPLNGIPRGLILGRISKLSAGHGAFPRVEVEPLVNFRGLEHVMLLVPPEAAP